MEIEDITKKVATELPASETIEHPLPDSAEGVKALEKESSEGHDGIVIQEPCEERILSEASGRRKRQLREERSQPS